MTTPDRLLDGIPMPNHNTNGLANESSIAHLYDEEEHLRRRAINARYGNNRELADELSTRADEVSQELSGARLVWETGRRVN